MGYIVALQLKGTTVYKADKDIKAGEEITIDAEFSAEQGPIDQLVTSRLERDRKEDRAKLAALETQLAAKAGDDGKTAALQNQITELSAKLSGAQLAERVDKALRKAGAADLEDEFRASIRADVADDDDAVASKVKAALKRREDLKKAWGATEKTPDPATGRVGSSGSSDETPAGKKHADLMALMTKNNPGLKAYVDRAGDKAAQTALLEKYKGQGLLESKSKK